MRMKHLRKKLLKILHKPFRKKARRGNICNSFYEQQCPNKKKFTSIYKKTTDPSST